MTYFPPAVFRLILAYIPTTKPAREHHNKLAKSVKKSFHTCLRFVEHNFMTDCENFNDVERHMRGRRYILPAPHPLVRFTYIYLDFNNNKRFRAHVQYWKNAMVKVVEAKCFMRGRLCLPSPLYDGDKGYAKHMGYCKWYEANILSSMYERPEYGHGDRLPQVGMLVYSTVYQMKNYCSDNRIVGYSKLKRKELALLIMKWDGKPQFYKRKVKCANSQGL